MSRIRIGAQRQLKRTAEAEHLFAHAITDVKAADDEKRIIEGIASTPSPDRMNDIVEPLGAEYNLPLPLLWQHRSGEPVGWVEFAKPNKNGIPFRARIAKYDEPGELKNLTDKAWLAVKSGLIRGVSIGFRRLAHEVLDNGGWKFTKWEWLELSLVTIPAQAEATITTIKSISQSERTALGGSIPTEQRESTAVTEPGASGKSKKTETLRAKRSSTMPKSVAEQLKAFRDELAAKNKAQDEIMAKSGEELVTLSKEEQEEYDTLQNEIDEIEKHISRLEKHAERIKARTVPAEGSDIKSGAESRSGSSTPAPRIQVQSLLPKGTAFTRYVIALARSKGNLMHAEKIAESDYKDTPEVAQIIKTAVAAGTTTDSTWAAPLVQYQQMTSEFIELLRPMTFLGRLPLRRVPFNISMPSQTAGASVNWVGEGRPKPVSKLAFDTVTLRFAKAAGIVVLTEELIRFSNPSAEAVVRQDLLETMAKFLDEQFLTPTVAEVSNVSPASVSYGVTAVPASGTNADALRADIKQVFSNLIAQNMSAAGCYWLMPERSALAISMMMNPLGQPEFPGLTATGGTLAGLPVLTSENVPALPIDPSSPSMYSAGDMIALVKPSEIMLADDGGVAIDISREASLQMDDTPTNPPDTSTVFRSLWQMNMVGVRAERWINWKKRRSGACQWIGGANYGEGA